MRYTQLDAASGPTVARAPRGRGLGRGHHLAASDDDNFDAFPDRYPVLLDKRLLARHYRSSTLATAEAKSGWVEPDLLPLPGAVGRNIR